jgi:hypothetical protein
MVQGLNFARFTGPSVEHRVMPWMQRKLTTIEPRFKTFDVEASAPVVRDGRRDFVHFWFYAWLATPAIWVADQFDINPVHAFTLLNLILLGLALRLALPKIGLPAGLLLFGSPIIWWIDKAHTEIFTFSMLTVAMVMLRDRPWWSMVAVGAAATQNPPIAAVMGLVAVSEVVARPSAVRVWKFWAGGAVGLALALLHPFYYYSRYGRWSLLTTNLHIGIPSCAAFTATVFDPQIGLLGNFPSLLLLALVGGVLLTRIAPRDLLERDFTIAGLAGLFFMFSAAQAFNVHHGGTPSISRYAFWLMPLAVPLLTRTELLRPRWWRRLLWGTSCISFAACCWAFNPSAGENAREPTWAASVIWNWLPSWSNPVPEVFSETIVGQDSSSVFAPVATRNCQKVLIAGRGPGMPMWPLPCPPAPIPSMCVAPLTFCYANLGRHGYGFAVAAGKYDPRKIGIQRTWPVRSEEYVQAVFNELDWSSLDNAPSRPGVVRGVRQVTRMWTWLGRDRLLIVLDGAGAEPSITLRPELPMTGRLLDVTSQRTVRELDTSGVAGPDWEVKLPAYADTLILTLRIR